MTSCHLRGNRPYSICVPKAPLSYCQHFILSTFYTLTYTWSSMIDGWRDGSLDVTFAGSLVSIWFVSRSLDDKAWVCSTNPSHILCKGSGPAGNCTVIKYRLRSNSKTTRCGSCQSRANKVNMKKTDSKAFSWFQFQWVDLVKTLTPPSCPLQTAFQTIFDPMVNKFSPNKSLLLATLDVCLTLSDSANYNHMESSLVILSRE